MPAEPPRSVADELAAGLESEAELVDHGALAIDAARGLAKLGRYQLADPHHYVLRLAEAGVRLGAQELWFWTTPDSLIAHFACAEVPLTLDASTLENLLMVLLGSEPGHGDRDALVQLAVAANAARQLEPAQLWIESIDAEGRGARVMLESAPQLVALHEGVPGLWFRFRQRPASLAARIRRRLGARAEVGLLREYACWAWTPIFVDNHRISHGFGLPHGTPIRDPARGQIGVAIMGGPDNAARPCVVLCAAGIEVERVHPLEAPAGFFALVEAGLPRDLGFARFHRGPAFDALLERTLGVRAAAQALAPKRGSWVRRRQTRAGRLRKAVTYAVASFNVIMMFAGAIAGSEAMVTFWAFAAIMGSPLLAIYGSARAKADAEVIAPKSSRIAAANRREPALPPGVAPAPLALPPAR